MELLSFSIRPERIEAVPEEAFHFGDPTFPPEEQPAEAIEWRSEVCNSAAQEPPECFTALWSCEALDIAHLGEVAVVLSVRIPCTVLIESPQTDRPLHREFKSQKGIRLEAGLQPGTPYSFSATWGESECAKCKFVTKECVKLHRICGLGEDFVRLNWIHAKEGQSVKDSGLVHTPLDAQETAEMHIQQVRAWGTSWEPDKESLKVVASSSTPIVATGLAPDTEYVIRLRSLDVLPKDLAAALDCDSLVGLHSSYASFVTHGPLNFKILWRGSTSLAAGWGHDSAVTRIVPESFREPSPMDLGVSIFFLAVMGHWSQNPGLKSRKEAQLRDLEEALALEDEEMSSSSNTLDSDEDTPAPRVRGDVPDSPRSADASMRSVDPDLKRLNRLDLENRISSLLKELRTEDEAGLFYIERKQLGPDARHCLFEGLQSLTNYTVQLVCYCRDERIDKKLRVTGKTRAAKNAAAPETNMSAIHAAAFSASDTPAFNPFEPVAADEATAQKTASDHEDEQEEAESDPTEDVNPAEYLSVVSLQETAVRISWSNVDMEEFARLQAISTAFSEWNRLGAPPCGDKEYADSQRQLTALESKMQVLQKLKEKNTKIPYLIKTLKLDLGVSEAPDNWADEERVKTFERESSGLLQHMESEYITSPLSASPLTPTEEQVVIEVTTSSYATLVASLEPGSRYAICIRCKRPVVGWMPFSEVTYFTTPSPPSLHVTHLQLSPFDIRDFYVLPVQTALQKEEQRCKKGGHLRLHTFRCYEEVRYQVKLHSNEGQSRTVVCSTQDYVKKTSESGEEENLGFRLTLFEPGMYTGFKIRMCLPGRHKSDLHDGEWGSWSEHHYIASRYNQLSVRDVGNGGFSLQWDVNSERRTATDSYRPMLSSILTAGSSSKTIATWSPEAKTSTLNTHTLEGLPYDRYRAFMVLTEYCYLDKDCASQVVSWSWSERFAAVALVRRFDPVMYKVGEEFAEIVCVQMEASETDRADTAAPADIDIGVLTPSEAATHLRYVELHEAGRKDASDEGETGAKDIKLFEVSLVNVTKHDSAPTITAFAPTSMLSGVVNGLLPQCEYTLALRPQLVNGDRFHWGQWSRTVHFRTLGYLCLDLKGVGEDFLSVSWLRPYPYPHVDPAASDEGHSERIFSQSRNVPHDMAELTKYLDKTYDFHHEYELSLLENYFSKGTQPFAGGVQRPSSVIKPPHDRQHTFENLKPGFRYKVKVRQAVALADAHKRDAEKDKKAKKDKDKEEKEKEKERTEGEDIYGEPSNCLAIWTAPSLVVTIGDVGEDSCKISVPKASSIVHMLERQFPTQDDDISHTTTVLQLSDTCVTSFQLRIIPYYSATKKYILHNPVLPPPGANKGTPLQQQELAWRHKIEAGAPIINTAVAQQTPNAADTPPTSSATPPMHLTYDCSDEVYPPYYEEECRVSRLPLEGSGRSGYDGSITANLLPSNDSTFILYDLDPHSTYGVSMRRIIDGECRGKWSPVLPLVTQGLIGTTLGMVSETYAAISWERRAEENPQIAPEEYASSMSKVASWQLAITGKLSSSEADVLSSFSKDIVMKESLITLPASATSHIFPQLVPENNYRVKVRSHHHTTSREGAWSRWSGVIHFTTKPPLMLVFTVVGSTYCCLSCFRKQKEVSERGTDEEEEEEDEEGEEKGHESEPTPSEPEEPEEDTETFEVRVFDHADEGWSQYQTTNDQSCIPATSTAPITISASTVGCVQKNVVRGLSSGRRYTAIARIVPSEDMKYTWDRWSVLGNFETLPPLEAKVLTAAEEYAVVEVARLRSLSTVLTYTLAVNEWVAPDKLRINPTSSTRLLIQGLTLNQLYVLKVSELIHKGNTTEDPEAVGLGPSQEWAKWQDLLVVSTTPQRPTAPVLYEHRDSNVSFFWKLESPWDIGARQTSFTDMYRRKREDDAYDALQIEAADVSGVEEAVKTPAPPSSDPALAPATEPEPETEERPIIIEEDVNDIPVAVKKWLRSPSGSELNVKPPTDYFSQLDEAPTPQPPKVRVKTAPVPEAAAEEEEEHVASEVAPSIISFSSLEDTSQYGLPAFREYAKRHLGTVIDDMNDGKRPTNPALSKLAATCSLVIQYTQAQQMPNSFGPQPPPAPCASALTNSSLYRYVLEAARREQEGKDRSGVCIGSFKPLIEVSQPFARIKLHDSVSIESYFFRLRTVCSTNITDPITGNPVDLSSRPSPIFSFNTPPPPRVPTGLILSDMLHTTALLKWSPPADVGLHNQVHYSVMLLNISGFQAELETWTEIARVRINGYFLTNLNIGESYKVKVRCCSAFGKSAYSNALSFSTLKTAGMQVTERTGFAASCRNLNDPRAVWRRHDYNWVFPSPTALDSTPLPFHSPFHLYKEGIPQLYCSSERARWNASVTVPLFIKNPQEPHGTFYPRSQNLLHRATSLCTSLKGEGEGGEEEEMVRETFTRPTTSMGVRPQSVQRNIPQRPSSAGAGHSRKRNGVR